LAAAVLVGFGAVPDTFFSTVYLRFHYVVDLLMGAVVALAGWWMPEKYEASTGSLQMLSSGLNNRQS